MRLGLLGVFAASAFASAAYAVQPDEILPDAALEARARAISSELRCLVCQNQSIDDSNAPLARDLRLLVRERLKADDSDQAVKDYIVARYGEFVLLKPPLNAETALLWLTPLLVLAGAIWLVVRSGLASGPKPAAVAEAERPLSVEEKKRLNDVLAGDGGA